VARGVQGADDPACGVTRPRPWVAAALVAVLIVGAIVIVLRLANDGPEPEGNWWLLAELILGLAYLPAGAALVVRRDRRLLGALFLVVGTMALATALSLEYDAYATAERATTRWDALAEASSWTWLLGGSVLATVVLVALLPAAWRADRWLRAVMAVAGLAIDRLAQQVGVTVVARVLLDHVYDDPPQIRRSAVRPTPLRELIEAAVRQCLGDQGARPLDRGVPQREQILR